VAPLDCRSPRLDSRARAGGRGPGRRGAPLQISTKFSREGIEAELGAAGLELRSWWTDAGGDFAVCLVAIVFVYSYRGELYTHFHAYLFGDEAPTVAARHKPPWQAWMHEHFLRPVLH
jgi:Histidine-specific methyltransferase, SAM-dependent